MIRPVSAVLDFLYPNRCGFCGEIISGGKLICRDCSAKVEFLPESADFGEYVDRGFDRLFVSCRYSGAVKSGILRLKNHRGFNTAKYICLELADRIEDAGVIDEIDFITFVPMLSLQKNAVGYNHAEVVARCLSRELGKPVKGGLIGKRKSRYRQHDQDAPARELLARMSYYPIDSAKNRAAATGKTVLLCDDIITTGSTLSSCAAVLKRLGAEKIYAAVLARSGMKT